MQAGLNQVFQTCEKDWVNFGTLFLCITGLSTSANFNIDCGDLIAIQKLISNQLICHKLNLAGDSASVATAVVQLSVRASSYKSKHNFERFVEFRS